MRDHQGRAPQGPDAVICGEGSQARTSLATEQQPILQLVFKPAFVQVPCLLWIHL